jgi:plastocyanin
MNKTKFRAVVIGTMCIFATLTPAFASTTRTFYLQTVVWVSKENPAQAKTVSKYGEVYGYAPSTLVVRQGDRVVLHIRNLQAGGDDGHTFTLPAYAINRSISPLASVTVSFTANKAGVFPFRCEFHKPWMGGELVVLPAR